MNIDALAIISNATFEITDTGLIIRGKPTFDEWYAFIESLSRKYSNIQWTIGDAINEGEMRFGEKYAQALDSHIYNYGTLRNYASIAGRIPKEVRSPKLRFHQSKYVAPLEPDEQKRILDFAADKNLSGDDIQELVNKVLGKPARTDSGQGTADISTSVIAEAIAWVNPTGDYLYIENQPDVHKLLRSFWHSHKNGDAKVRVTITPIDETDISD